LGVALILILSLAAVAISATVGWRPFIGPASRSLTTRAFERTPARLARGKYLAESVNGCFGCHSDIDEKSPGRPVLAGREGCGRAWTAEGMPWLVAPNITPDAETGAGSWSDDMLARAIREGIGHDGRALFPIMPYERYREMSDEDLASVIVYVRSIKALHNALPLSAPPFPLNRLINAAPRPITAPVPDPDLSTPAKRGGYLVTLAACADCHTPMDDKGRSIAGLEFAGGFPLHCPQGLKHSANLTPDATGIPYYDEGLFVEVIRSGRVKARELNGAMPWIYYRGMTDEDLKSMFAWLRALPPVKHSVDNTEPPTKCKRCGYEHGAGIRN
jgi:mono/diheme cytochrome c family protein